MCVCTWWTAAASVFIQLVRVCAAAHDASRLLWLTAVMQTPSVLKLTVKHLWRHTETWSTCWLLQRKTKQSTAQTIFELCSVCSAVNADERSEPVWQFGPPYCGGQRHSRTPRISLQIPPFRHGLKPHRFRSTQDNSSVNSETLSAEWLELVNKEKSYSDICTRTPSIRTQEHESQTTMMWLYSLK